MPASIQGIAHKIQAIVFINHVIMFAGCGALPADLERWGEAFESKKGLTSPGGGFTGKWRRFLQGRLPQGKLRSALIDEFPRLQEVLDNPLWKILRALEDSPDHGSSLMATLTVDGTPLSVRRFKRLQRRITTADWQDLGYWLVILASQHSRDAWARELMHKRFMAYLLLVCAQSAFSNVETWLYPLLDQHFRESHLAPVASWPANLSNFRILLRAFKLLPHWSMRLAEIPAEDAGKVEYGFIVGDEEGGQWAQSGYCFYFDVNFNRLELKPKDQRYLSPLLNIRLADVSKCKKGPATGASNAREA